METFIEKDACELLDADHIAVKHLFVDYARLAMAPDAEPGAEGQKQALAAKICSELTVHAQIEEEIFYPALQEAIGQPQLLDEARVEHQEAKDLIAQIQSTTQPGMVMDELVSLLARTIEQHVKEERDVLFPKARALLDLDALGAQLKERQAELEAGAAPAPAPAKRKK